MVNEFPSSNQIIVVAADITGSADPSCSDSEKESLETQATADWSSPEDTGLEKPVF